MIRLNAYLLMVCASSTVISCLLAGNRLVLWELSKTLQLSSLLMKVLYLLKALVEKFSVQGVRWGASRMKGCLRLRCALAAPVGRMGLAWVGQLVGSPKSCWVCVSCCLGCAFFRHVVLQSACVVKVAAFFCSQLLRVSFLGRRGHRLHRRGCKGDRAGCAVQRMVVVGSGGRGP